MSVRVSPARGGKGWEYDIRIQWPDRTRHRERAKAPTASKSATKRWAEERERVLFAAGKEGLEKAKVEARPQPKVPTLGDFWPRIVSDHYKANRLKPSTVEGAESIYQTHLIELAANRLDEITDADVSALKGRLVEHKPKTVNNVLSVLSRTLRCAVKWRVLRELPCSFGLLKIPTRLVEWYDVSEYRRGVDEARGLGVRYHALYLLAGSGGLRRGEIRALAPSDVDFSRMLIGVENAFWRTIEGSTKGSKHRYVPMTEELSHALRKVLEGSEGAARVLTNDDGEPISNRTIRAMLARIQRRAKLRAAGGATPTTGGIHILRHTYCSHLAAAGVPAKTIQDIAGHEDLKTTLKYMHLSPTDRNVAAGALASYYGARPTTMDGRRDNGRPEKPRLACAGCGAELPASASRPSKLAARGGRPAMCRTCQPGRPSVS